MAFGLAKALMLLQLSLLFIGSFAAEIDTLDPPKIALPPLPPKIPTFPSNPFNRVVAVRGTVVRKACEYAGQNHIYKATPVSGANVTMLCRVGKDEVKNFTATTDKNGYYFLQASKYVDPERCKVLLEKCTKPDLGKPSKFNDSKFGQYLNTKDQPIDLEKYFALFTAQPLAYEPAKCPKI